METEDLLLISLGGAAASIVRRVAERATSPLRALILDTDDATLRMMSGQGREVLVVLPPDAEFLTEIQAYLKIEGFLRKNTSTQLAKYETIKEAKRREMRERNQNAKLYLTEALKVAAIVLA